MTDYIKQNRRNLIFAGILIIGAGKLWLFHEMGLFNLPEWMFSWKTFLIAFGLIIGLMTRFKEWFWMVPVSIGTIFLLGDIPGIEFDVRKYAWPIIIILFGTFLLVRAFMKRGPNRGWNNSCIVDSQGGEDNIDLVSIFGGHKRKLFSKHFKGGEVVNIFGGTELDLSQADIQGTVVIDNTNVFGGMKITVPANWEVRTEMTSIMGGTDDKRTTREIDHTKVLVLTGVCIFGGVDVRSH
jgi:predicted membrane protein